MTYVPRYAANTAKALETILWVVHERQGFDVYKIVKSAFFADKYHVGMYGRPVCGDTYVAAPYGPLPQVIYNLLKHDPIEIIALNNNGSLPFCVDRNHRVTISREPNLRVFSRSDIEALQVGIQAVDGKSFDEIVQETHADPAYSNATGMQMDYRDFISDEDDLKDEKSELISDTAPYAVF